MIFLAVWAIAIAANPYLMRHCFGLDTADSIPRWILWIVGPVLTFNLLIVAWFNPVLSDKYQLRKR